MKPISILSLLAVTTSPTLSQPYDAATVNTPESAPIEARSSSVPSICNERHVIVSDQLNEITYLKSKKLPVTHDLAGYYYVIVNARKMFGCPSGSFASSNSSSDASSSRQSKRSSESTSEIPCRVIRTLRGQVDEQMKVLDDNDISTPDYLAGWFSGTNDLSQVWGCGLPPMSPEEQGNSSSSVSAED